MLSFLKNCPSPNMSWISLSEKNIAGSHFTLDIASVNFVDNLLSHLFSVSSVLSKIWIEFSYCKDAMRVGTATVETSNSSSYLECQGVKVQVKKEVFRSLENGISPEAHGTYFCNTFKIIAVQIIQKFIPNYLE